MVLPNDNVTEETMPTEERMTIDRRYEYLRRAQKHYLKATRKQRSLLLDHMEFMTGLNRKTLIRHMKRKVIERKPRRKQRGRIYGHQVDDALRVISESLDYICAERLTPQLVPMAKHLAAHGELQPSDDLLAQLARISVSTVRRRLHKFERLEHWRLPRRAGPKQRNPLTRDIPAERIPWDEQEPGHFEVDLVHHSGASSSGHYVHTVQMIDVATGWSERAATLGRSQLVMEDAFRRMLARLPFPVQEIHPDNGSEFFNHHLITFWRNTVKGVRLSRSKPWYKNDNRFVEQKNASLVRAYLGDVRLDSVEQTKALNELYEKMWLYYNLFQPVMRMTEKSMVETRQGGHRAHRVYDDPQTPFQRLCGTEALSEVQRQQLQSLRDRTNPRQLRREIYQLLDKLLLIPGAEPGTTEDAYTTLAVPVKV
jgi:IS30 family transposase